MNVKIKLHKVIAKNKKGIYETHLFEGYPNVKYVTELMRGNNFKVSGAIAIDEHHFEEEKQYGATIWSRF